MEVSAKTAYQVEDAFKKNAENLLEKIDKGIIDTKKDVGESLSRIPELK